MIKIVNNDKELTVTKGAYENLYKKLGYEIVKEIKTPIKDVEVSDKIFKKQSNDKRYK